MWAYDDVVARGAGRVLGVQRQPTRLVDVEVGGDGPELDAVEALSRHELGGSLRARRALIHLDEHRRLPRLLQLDGEGEVEGEGRPGGREQHGVHARPAPDADVARRGRHLRGDLARGGGGHAVPDERLGLQRRAHHRRLLWRDRRLQLDARERRLEERLHARDPRRRPDQQHLREVRGRDLGVGQGRLDHRRGLGGDRGGELVELRAGDRDGEVDALVRALHLDLGAGDERELLLGALAPHPEPRHRPRGLRRVHLVLLLELLGAPLEEHVVDAVPPERVIYGRAPL
mmetsp:Transcript_44005/g.104721  ORF Transcript_44005/g.104721 Transcript_44005/m.104721 type:complete len:288 (-) Transcript_44005:734-1597(-)